MASTSRRSSIRAAWIALKNNKSAVWDRPQRVLHWGLVALVVPAGFTGNVRGNLHLVLGYGALAIVAARLAWGFMGGRYARFSQFVRSPRLTLDYARAVLHGRAPRYLGHNPLGAWMILALMSAIALLALSGWLFTTDWLWGYGWLMDIHLALAWLLAALAALHVSGAILTGRRHGENLVSAMFSGGKRPAEHGDIV